MKKAIIIGATGFGGLGLIEILRRHPELKVKQLVARKDTGKRINEVFTHLNGYCDLVVQDTAEIEFDGLDIAFFSTPDRAGMSLARDFLDRGIKLIDFSGDFRFQTEADYEIYATNKGMETDHKSPDLLRKAVYGLPEKNREKIAKAEIVGNPGCFSICMILGLLPASEMGLIGNETIICDGKTGVSGAGKNSGEANLYPQRHENVNTYREGRHQHLVEVENTVNAFAKMKHKIMFVPQIVPMNRGIMTTVYAAAAQGLDTQKIQKIYRDYYIDMPFVKITESSPNTSDVRGSNRCLIRPMVDKRTGTLFVTSVIDNLIKGQAGNAVQNANIMLGFDETTALNTPAFYP